MLASLPPVVLRNMDPYEVESHNTIWNSRNEFILFTFLENVVYDRSGEIPWGGEDGRVVEHAHLVARNLVILKIGINELSIRKSFVMTTVETVC